MTSLFLMYWLLAGFVSYTIAGNYFKNIGEIEYDDSLWMLIFGGWISLISIIMFIIKGKR